MIDAAKEIADRFATMIPDSLRYPDRWYMGQVWFKLDDTATAVVYIDGVRIQSMQEEIRMGDNKGPELQDWQKRVVVEKAELDAKIIALTQFLECENIITLVSPDDFDLLVMQQTHMLHYSDILDQRIAGFSSTQPPMVPPHTSGSNPTPSGA